MAPSTRVLAGLALAAACTAQLAYGQVPSASSSLEQQVLAARLESARAYQNCDVEGMGKSLTVDYISTTAPGAFTGRPQLDASWKNCQVSNRQEERAQGLKVTPYGGGALVEGVRSFRTMNGGEWSAPRRFLEVWVKQEGRWREAAHHGTLIDLSPDAPSFAKMPPRRGDRREAVATAGRSIPDATGNLTATVAEADTKFNKAVADGDADALRRLTSEDYSHVGRNGVAVSRAEYLSDHAAVKGYTAKDVTVRQYGDLAIVAAATTADGSFDSRYTRIWVRDASGEWTAVMTQASPVYRRDGSSPSPGR